MAVDEFSPEQQVMVAVMRSAGHPDPEAVVRADPIAAALMGSHLAPVLERMAGAATEALDSYLRARKDRRERNFWWSLGFATSLIIWWGIIAAVRWAM